MEETPEVKRAKVVANLNQLNKKVKTTDKECKSKMLEVKKAEERKQELEHTAKSLEEKIMATKKRLDSGRKKVDESEKKEKEEIARCHNNLVQIEALKKRKSAKKVEIKQLKQDVRSRNLDALTQEKTLTEAQTKEQDQKKKLSKKMFHLRLLVENEFIKQDRLAAMKKQYDMRVTVMMLRNSDVEKRLEGAEDKVKELTEKVNKRKAEANDLEKKRLECEKEFELYLSDSDTESVTEEVADDKKKNEQEGQTILKKSVSFNDDADHEAGESPSQQAKPQNSTKL